MYIFKNFYVLRYYVRLFMYVFLNFMIFCRIGNILIGKYLNKELNLSEYKIFFILIVWEERVWMKKLIEEKRFYNYYIK